MQRSMITVVALGLSLLCGCGESGSSVQDGEPVNTVERSIILKPGMTLQTLKQNWSDADANWFYNVTQGSQLIPYRWFLHLEQPDNESPFLDAAHIRELGYIPRSTQQSSNPGGLPVGFTKDIAYDNGAPSLGLTCAACHTNLIYHNDVAYLIDGGSTMGDVQTLLMRLQQSLRATLDDEEKFDRLASALELSEARQAAQLRQKMEEVYAARTQYYEHNMQAADPNGPRFGHGRVDALGAILNEVTATFLDLPSNVTAADAPVSYPFIWDAPQHDFVQWNGAAENNEMAVAIPVVGTRHIGALGRNCGEVLGVFGTTDPEQEHGVLGGYESTVNKANLIEIEERLRTLWSPLWPKGLGPIDPDLKAKGEELFARHCAECHDDSFDRTSGSRRITARMVDAGTDQLTAKNFAIHDVQTGIIEGRRRGLFSIFDRLQAIEPGSEVLKHMVIRTVVHPDVDTESIDTQQRALLAFEVHIHANVMTNQGRIEGDFQSITTQDNSVALRAAPNKVRFHVEPETDAAEPTTLELHVEEDLALFSNQDKSVQVRDLQGISVTLPAANAEFPVATLLTSVEAVRFQYKARPLNGIWATSPYLHNGSVPNLYEILLPASERSPTFYVGNLHYDTEKVGYRSESGPFLYDTSLRGNSNEGHEFATKELDTDQRKQLLEYLKTL